MKTMKMLAYQSFHWDAPKGILEDTLYSRCHHGNILLSSPLSKRIQPYLVLAQSKKVRKLVNQIYVNDCQLFHLSCWPVSQRKWIFIQNEISFTHKFYMHVFSKYHPLSLLWWLVTELNRSCLSPKQISW